MSKESKEKERAELVQRLKDAAVPELSLEIRRAQRESIVRSYITYDEEGNPSWTDEQVKQILDRA